MTLTYTCAFNCLVEKSMLRSQAHCQVAQKANTQTKTWTKSLPAPPQNENNAQLLTAAHTPLPN